MDTRLGQPTTGEAPYERPQLADDIAMSSMQRPDQWHTRHSVPINGVPHMLTGEQCAEMLRKKLAETEAFTPPKLAQGLKPEDHWMMNAQLERDNRLRIALIEAEGQPTLRDRFAMAALSALGFCEDYRMDDLNHMAYVAYAMADRMMKARKQ